MNTRNTQQATDSEYEVSTPTLENRKKGRSSIKKRQITVEYLPSVQIQIILPYDLKVFHTSNWLLTHARNSLAEECKRQGLQADPISSVTTLKTTNNDFCIDYLLTSKDQRLSYLPSEITLVTHERTSNADSLTKVGLEDFELKARIGQGTHSQIFLVRWKADGMFYALKQMPKSKLTSKLQQKLLLERDVMAKVDSPFIVKLHFAFQTENFTYYVMDYAHFGTLATLESKVLNFKENDIKFYAAELILAFDALHSHGYSYGNLKKENLLIALGGHIMLCDFEKLTDFGNSPGLKPKEDTTRMDTIKEVEEDGEKKPTDFTSDFRSLGIFLYELLFGYTPSIENFTQTLSARADPKQPMLTPACKDLVFALIKEQPTNEPKKIRKYLEHQWFKSWSIQDLEEKNVEAPYVPDPLTISLSVMEGDASNIESTSPRGTKSRSLAIKGFTFINLQPEEVQRQKELMLQKTQSESYSWSRRVKSISISGDSKLNPHQGDESIGTEEFTDSATTRVKRVMHFRSHSNTQLLSKKGLTYR